MQKIEEWGIGRKPNFLLLLFEEILILVEKCLV